MIINDRQLGVTRRAIARFEAGLEELTHPPQGLSDNDLAKYALQARAIASLLEDLRTEAADYERLRAGAVRQLPVTSIEDLPTALVQARIAAGLTQRALAERLGLKEQQIQRYESSGYAGASFQRVAQVVSALGLTVPGHVILPSR